MTITTTIPGASGFAASVEVSDDHPRDRLADELVAAIPRALAGAAGSQVQVWIQGAADADVARLAPLGLVPYRDLLQLRCPLPAEPSGIVTRAFDADHDIDPLIEVNNRAFAWHPEQSGMDRPSLVARLEEPWFDAAGFRILELDGRLAGFCWTKVHPERPGAQEPALGEIYVIAIDPDFHGRGLGRPMTLAGLEWLTGAGLGTAMLFVESDNAAALATYRRIGFIRHAVNRAFRFAS